MTMIQPRGLLLFLLLQNAPEQTPQQPIFRGGADVVEVDVIVKDERGRFVEGLSRDDFEIEEDGRRQQVETAFLVRGSAPAESAENPAATAAEASRPRRLFVLMFDDQHISPEAFRRLRLAAETFLRDVFQDGRDIGGIVSGGRMRDNRLTTRRAELMQAVQSLKPSGDRTTRFFDLNDWPRFISEVEAMRVNAGDAEALRQVVARAQQDQPGGRFEADGAVVAKAARIASEVRSAAIQTLDTLQTLAAGLGRLPGRKTVVFLTSGFYINEGWARLSDVVGRAARGRVVFYTIDASGLDRTAAGRTVRDGQLSETDMRPLAAFDTWEDAPNSVAVDSGGLVLRNTNDFAGAFVEIARDTSTYYVLGYTPTVPPDGTFRRITIRVRRPNVTVRARQGYVAEARAVPPAPATPAPEPAAAPPVFDIGRAPVIRARLEQARVEAPMLAPAIDALLAARPDDALAALQRSSGAAPSVSDLIAGLAYFARRDVDAAVAALGRAVRALPSDPIPSFVLGWAQTTAGHDREAAGAYRNAARIAPSLVPAHLALADAYLRMSRPELAIQALRAGLAANPTSLELRDRLQALQNRPPGK